jgi:N-formylglutamate amidohydrolase
MSNFEVIPGDPESMVILHVPHASTRIPDYLRADIVLSDSELLAELHAITDARTDDIARVAASNARTRPWIFINQLSRLVVDPERFPDESEEMNQVGMGAVYERTTEMKVLRNPSPASRSALLSKYFVPYSEALAHLVDERLASLGRVTIIDIHSYPRTALPYELHGDGVRPEICIGTDEFHTPAALQEAAVRCASVALGNQNVALNSPFTGCYVPLNQYQINPQVSAVMLEFRRDIVQANFDALVDATAMLVDECPETGGNISSPM